MRVGVYENSPKVGLGADGKPEGIFVDLLEAIAREEGWRLQWVPGTWSEGLARLSAGEIDLMPDVAFTPERDRELAFHREPVLSSWNQVYARRRSGIRSLPDLEGKRVAVLEGSVQDDLFRQMVAAFGFGVTLVPAPDFGSAFRAVAEGRADAAVTNRFYGARHAAAAGLEDTAIVFAPTRLFYAAPLGGDPARLAAIDRHLLAFKGDPGSVYYDALRRWTTEELRPAVPRWLAAASVAGAALLLAAGAGLVLLRREIAARAGVIRRQDEQLAVVNRTLRATGSSLDLRTVLAEATRGALELTGCDSGVLYVLDPELGRFRPGVRVPDAGGDGPGAPLDAEAAERLQALASAGRPSVLPAGAKGTVAPPGQAPDPSVGWHAHFPLETQDRIVGLLSLSSRRSAAPARRGVRLVQELCVPVALAMENARLYEEARGHAAELERRVAERTSELAEAKHAAEAADRIKSTFLATMSHELRTPLNSIIGFTGIVSQGLAGPLNEEQKKQLGMVRESAQHLLALINDVLDISKIEAGQLAVDAEPFDLPAVVRKVAAIVGPLAEKKGLSLTVEVREGVAGMVGDARRVQQILLNLLGNAVKFTESGSVSLTVELVQAPGPGEAAGPGAAVRLRVADTGIGIREEDMAELFRPFRQVGSAASRRNEGTGLGLAICSRLAALMGGRVEAASRFREGSVFTLVLPLEGPGHGGAR